MKVRVFTLLGIALAVVLCVSLVRSIQHARSVDPRRGYMSAKYEGVLTTDAGTMYKVLIIEGRGSISLHEGITVVLSDIAHYTRAIDGFADVGGGWNSIAYCGDHPKASKKDTWGARCNRMSLGPQGWRHDTPFSMAGPPLRMDLAYPGEKNEPLSQSEIDFAIRELDAAMRIIFSKKHMTSHRYWDDKLGLIETFPHPSS